MQLFRYLRTGIFNITLRSIRYLLSCLLITLCSGSLFAQADFVSFGHLTTEHGLSQDLVSSITQTEEGFLWFGTNDGLTRYDGRTCTVFRHLPGDTNTLPDNRISGLSTDPKGWLWVSTVDGICYLNPATRRFQQLRIPSPFDPRKLQKGYFSNISWDKNGKGWAIADSFLLCLDRASLKAEYFKIPCTTKQESLVFADSKGRIWITIIGWHLLRFDPHTAQFHYMRGQNRPKDALRPWPMRIEEDSQGTIWNSDWDRAFYTYDEAQDKFVEIPKSGGIATVFLFEERPGTAPRIWAGGGQYGLWQLDCATMTRVDFRPNSRDTWAHNNSRAYALHRDPKTGIIWIGTEKGVEFCNPNGIQFGRIFLPDTGTQDQFFSVSCMAPDPVQPNRYWLGVWAVGLFAWDRDKGTYQHFRDQDKALFSNEIFDIACDSQGIFWLATAQGVERFDPKTHRHKHFHFPTPTKKGSYKTLSVEAGPDGRIWQATNRGELLETDPRTGQSRWVPLRQYNGAELPVYSIWNMHWDNRGRLLIPAHNGLIRYDPARQQNDHILHRYPALVVLDAVCGLDRRLYVGTPEGVYVLNDRDSVLFVLTTQNGLNSQLVRNLDVDQQGNIWIGTSNGLHRYFPENGRIEYFSKADGLFMSDMTQGFRVLPTNELFVSGDYSFNFASLREQARNAPAPRLALDGIKVLDNPVVWRIGQTLRLRPGENVLSVQVALIQFTRAANAVLAYQLEGFDEHWTESQHNVIAFTNLDPGKYTLRVRARNADGVWSANDLEIPILVIPPFYQTWWFYSLAGLFLLGIAGGTYRYRRGVRLRLAAMQARAVALERQQLLNEIALLKTQVNPHFLFNSLSILSSLVHIDADLSEQFIDQLSRSYRYILEQKDQSLVTIRTEMEFIQAYVFLLKIRFENKLDLDIKLDEHSVDHYKIAPLTLQLLVENAVKHNRMSSQEPLLIHVEQQGDLLEVRNPYRPRGESVRSTGVGLQNIINRYALLTERPVWAGEREDEFVVKIPLLNGESNSGQTNT